MAAATATRAVGWALELRVEPVAAGWRVLLLTGVAAAAGQARRPRAPSWARAYSLAGDSSKSSSHGFSAEQTGGGISKVRQTERIRSSWANHQG